MSIPNTIIEAGAGTGKTYQVMKMLCEGLKSGQFAIDNVAVITFTRKAAAELQERVMKMLQEEALSNPKLAEQLLNLGNAHISTIHSFCEGLLKALPVEAGIDPAFSILEDTDESDFFTRIYTDWISMKLENDSEDLELLCLDNKIPVFNNPYNQYGHDKSLQSLIGKYISHRELDLFTLSLPEKDLPELISEFKIKASEIISEIIDDDNLKDFFTIAMVSLTELDVEDPEAYAAGLNTVKFTTRSGKRIYSDQKADFKALCQDFVADAKYKALFSEIDRAHQAFNRLAHEFKEYYREAMRLEGVMDFTEILIKTEELLRTHQEAREYFKQKFKFLFIDEFQDTDPIQTHIIFFLAEKLGGKADKWEDVELAENKLCVVGDPKQSIYRFRRADIEIYSTVAEKIRQAGEKKVLDKSFRSGENVLDWINDFFKDHLVKDKEWQVDYQPITIAPKEDRDKGDPPNKNLDKQGEIIFVQPDLPEEVCQDPWKVDDIRELEARTTAKWIQENGGKYGFENILVLYRKTVNMQLTADYLEELGVACEVVGGKSFFARQEVIDLNLFLKAIVDPLDSVSILAALKGPFFCLMDTQLCQWKLQNKEDHRFAYNGKITEKFDLNHPVSKALIKLKELHLSSNLKSAHEILQLELTERKLLVSYRSTWHGRRRVMNILKTLALLKEFEAWPCRKAVEEFSRHIESQAEMADYSPHTGKNEAVQLMTIHRAKGLEAQVVYLADTASNPFSPDGTFIDNQQGMLFYSLPADILTRHKVKVADLAPLEEIENSRIEAEEGRLRYVAATRAIKALVINHRPVKLRGDSTIFRLLEIDCDSPELVDVEGLQTTYKKSISPEAYQVDYQEQWDNRVKQLASNLGESSKPSMTIISPSSAEVAERGSELKVNVMYDPVDYSYKVEAGQAADVGTLVHKLLELQPEDIKTAAQSLIREAGSQVKPEALAERYLKVKEKTDSICSGATNILREVPIKYRDDSGLYYDGIIDLLVEKDDGWLVIDYKILTAEYTQDELAEKYKGQLNVYREGLEKLGMKVNDVILLSP